MQITLADIRRAMKNRKRADAVPAPVDQYGQPMGAAPPAVDPGMAQAGAAPPMDPAMMGGGGAMPPMDPAAMMGGGGAMPPMDPAAMGGMPMDPAMMGGAPPAGGMPMDPAAMAAMLGGGGEGGAPPLMQPGEEATPEGEVDDLEEKLRAVVQEAIKPLEERLASLEAASEEQSGFDDALFQADPDVENEEVVKQASADLIADLLEEDKPEPAKDNTNIFTRVLSKLAKGS